MRSRLILGRYVDTNSWVHRLDPRSKVTGMIVYVCIIFMISSLIEIIVVGLFSIFIMLNTKIPFKLFIKAVKPLIFLIIFIALFHILFDSSGTQVLSLGLISMYSGGLESGLIAALRMILFISFTAVLTFTTTPYRLTQGMESILTPLKWFRISPQKITLMITIALRFIPTVMEEAEKILKSQASRGFDLTEKSLREKARTLLSLLVPVTVSAIKRAHELTDSMESRGYRLGMPRSRFHIMQWSLKESLYSGSFLILLSGVIILGVWL